MNQIALNDVGTTRTYSNRVYLRSPFLDAALRGVQRVYRMAGDMNFLRTLPLVSLMLLAPAAARADSLADVRACLKQVDDEMFRLLLSKPSPSYVRSPEEANATPIDCSRIVEEDGVKRIIKCQSGDCYRDPRNILSLEMSGGVCGATLSFYRSACELRVRGITNPEADTMDVLIGCKLSRDHCHFFWKVLACDYGAREHTELLGLSTSEGDIDADKCAAFMKWFGGNE